MRAISRIMGILAGFGLAMDKAELALKSFGIEKLGKKKYRAHSTKRYSLFTPKDRKAATAARKRGKKEKIFRKIRSRRSLSSFKHSR